MAWSHAGMDQWSGERGLFGAVLLGGHGLFVWLARSYCAVCSRRAAGQFPRREDGIGFFLDIARMKR